MVVNYLFDTPHGLAYNASMLTPRQDTLLRTIQCKRETDGFSPTIDDLRRVLKIKSTQTVHAAIEDLRDLGLIERGNGHRTLRLTKKGIKRVLAG